MPLSLINDIRPVLKICSQKHAGCARANGAKERFRRRDVVVMKALCENSLAKWLKAKT